MQKAVIEDWNLNYVVIANCNTDPYYIDTGMDNFPAYYAAHGEGEWEFEIDSESLEEFFDFLKGLERDIYSEFRLEKEHK